jgi:HlyD family secretion protein
MKRAAALLFVVLVLGGAAWVPLRHGSAAEPTAAPTAPTSIHARGRLEPRGGVITLGAPARLGISTVGRLLVQEGQGVEPGDVIAYLDSYASLHAAVAQAERQVEIARKRLALVRVGTKREDIDAQSATMERLKTEALQGESDLARQEALFASRLISQAEIEAQRSKVKELRRELEQAQHVLGSMRTIRPEDIALAEATLAESEANLARARAEEEMGITRSPIHGRVLRIRAHAGARVGDEGVVELGDTDLMYMVAEIYESDRSRIRPGAEAEIACGGLDRKLRGVVERVGIEVSRHDPLRIDSVGAREARVVEVWVKLKDSAAVRDMTYLQAEARIEP